MHIRHQPPLVAYNQTMLQLWEHHAHVSEVQRCVSWERTDNCTEPLFASGCSGTWYCTTKCAAAHWKYAGHRTACQTLSARRDLIRSPIQTELLRPSDGAELARLKASEQSVLKFQRVSVLVYSRSAISDASISATATYSSKQPVGIRWH